jgi:patatin-like phospholipase/acyl hydrolase
VQVLGELGLMQNIKRFAGTSVGSMIAAMAAVGCTPEEMMEAFGIDIGNYMLGIYPLAAILYVHYLEAKS